MPSISATKKDDDQPDTILEECTADVDELINHFGGLGSGTVGDAILQYMGSSDCSPSTRTRIRNFFHYQPLGTSL